MTKHSSRRAFCDDGDLCRILRVERTRFISLVRYCTQSNRSSSLVTKTVGSVAGNKRRQEAKKC